MIVVALANLDTGLPRADLSSGWPFLVVAIVLIFGTGFYLARKPGKPGWLHFVFGLLIPEIAFAVNRLFAVEVSWIFWLTLLILIVSPIPIRRPTSE